jgi:hypothetical protein
VKVKEKLTEVIKAQLSIRKETNKMKLNRNTLPFRYLIPIIRYEE